MRHYAVAMLGLFLCGCAPEESGHLKAIIGAVLIDGAGGPPLANSIVLVAGDRIRAAGALSSIPIPADADKVDGSGDYLVPALVDVCDRIDPPGTIHATTAEDARRQVSALVAQKIATIHIGKLPDAAAEAVLEAAREIHIPVIAHISTQPEARFAVNKGAAVLVGMIHDTESLDQELLGKLRDLRIVVAPSLGKAGSALDVAKRNTMRLFQAGAPLALASEGGNPLGELALMSDAGVPPLDVVVAATRNGAVALHQAQECGTIEAERRADLLLLSANPAEDVRNLRKVALRVVGGEFVH